VRAWVAVLVAAGVLPGSCAAVEMTAEVWKRQVLPEEPILVRVTMTNAGDRAVRVVPPYVRPRTRDTGYALGLRVEDAGGEWSEPGLRLAGACWLRLWTSPEAAAVTRVPWSVEPGESVRVWCSLNMVYSLHEQGRYHLKLVSDPKPEMVQVPGAAAHAAPVDLVCEQLEADLGWVEIVAPPEAERLAAAYLSEHGSACAPSLWSGPYEHYAAVAEGWPGSAYLPYALFYAMRAEAQRGLQHGAHFAGGVEELRSGVEAFRAAHPDFPLNHQLDTLLAWYKYGVVHDTVYPPVAPPIPVPTRQQVLSLVQAGRDLKAVARISEDRGLMAEIDAQVDWIELVHRDHIEAALAGREPG